MKVHIRLAGALLCAFAFTAVAQEHAHGHDKKAPAMDPAMMEAMMKAGTPGDPQKKLEAFAGTWETKMIAWMMPGAEPMMGTGTATNQMVMDGRYLEQRFDGSFMGMPFKGLGFTGYDNVKKQYWGSWMDNMGTAMMTTTGALAEDGKTWTFTGMMADPMTAKDMRMDEKITINDADRHTMEMWAPGPDGKMFKNMEIVFTRKK